MSLAIRALLEGLVSEGSLLSEEEGERWRTGPGEGGLPLAVLVPSSEDELALVLQRASQEGWRVLPAGQGLWLQGGGPAEVTLVVSTRRLASVLEYEPADLTFTAGAGLTLEALRAVTRPHGQWLPLDPPGGENGSLGAAIALGVEGSLRPLYGLPRDHVLGLTLVSGGGEILHWGGRVVKNVAGFDITRLCVGSWGILGMISAVSCRLHPIPEADRTLVLAAREVDSLLAPAQAISRSSLPLAALELLDPLPEGLHLAGREAMRAPTPAVVVRILGSRAEVEEVDRRIRDDVLRGAGDLWALEQGDSTDFHRALNRWEEGAALVVRMSLLPSQLGVLLGETRGFRGLGLQDSGRWSLDIAAHVSSGTLRFAVRPGSWGGTGMEALASELRRLRSSLETEGGSLTFSHGPAWLVREVGAWGAGGEVGKITAALKSQFDPHGILAPGRLGT